MATAKDNPFGLWIATGLLVTLVGSAMCAVIARDAVDILWRTYYFGLMVWWPVTMGGLGLVALGNLTGGRWAAAGRPFYLAAANVLPVWVILFVPLVFGLEQIFPWANESDVVAHEFSPSKATYLSPTFFLGRSASYILVWLIVWTWLGGVSRLDRPPASRPSMRRAGALSLVLLVPTTTFAAFDWIMSLEPHWYSSIFGGIISAGGVVAVHALAVLGLTFAPKAMKSSLHTTRTHGGEPDTIQLADVFNDLGNLLLAFIMVWTYFSFSQFFLIWSANLPSEITWYVPRMTGAFGMLSLLLVLLCFVAPFLMLLSRDLKREPGRLTFVAAIVIVGYALNMLWTIVPSFIVGQPATYVAYLAAMLGLGGLWLALFAWRVNRLGIQQRR